MASDGEYDNRDERLWRRQTIVTAALAAKSSAETPKKAPWEARSETMRREIS